jgi:tetratricopeptide (TPR) repeat protein
VRGAAFALAVALVAAAALGGCGDRDLWARWRAERAGFHAQRSAAAVIALGRDAPARERAAAERRLEAIVAEFPPGRWGTPPASGPARDVAIASARASMGLARLAAAAGDDAKALERWRAAREQWGALPGVVVRSRAGAIRALERLGRYDEALAERVALAQLDPLGDPDRTGPSPDVLAAPIEAAGQLRELGRSAEAAALLAGADGRFAAALSRAGAADGLLIARALADIRVGLGDAPGALAALRATLSGLRAWEVPPRALALAACAFEAGEHDSAIVYARWAASVSGSREVAGPALVLAARAWEAVGRTDSAFAAYDALFDRWADPGAVGPEAHFRRACLLEGLGQWERARAEFVSLGAAAPTHPLAFEATTRVLRHLMKAGQYEMARAEGENAVDRLDHLLATNRDASVQRKAGVVRAEVLVALGYNARAESSLVDLWRRFPEDSTAEAAGLRGASLAEQRPGGRAAAAAILDELAAHAANSVVRRLAAERRTGSGSRAPGAQQ